MIAASIAPATALAISVATVVSQAVLQQRTINRAWSRAVTDGYPVGLEKRFRESLGHDLTRDADRLQLVFALLGSLPGGYFLLHLSPEQNALASIIYVVLVLVVLLSTGGVDWRTRKRAPDQSGRGMLIVALLVLIVALVIGIALDAGAIHAISFE